MLSGFLITHLLLAELGTRGHLDLGGFWLRRLRRLVPAILTLLLVCTSVALLVGGDALLSIRRQILTALTFSYNWGRSSSPGPTSTGG